MSVAAPAGEACSTTAPPTRVPVPTGRANSTGPSDSGPSRAGPRRGLVAQGGVDGGGTAGSSASRPAATSARPVRSKIATP